jgi:short-subunit dehydrogenase
MVSDLAKPLSGQHAVVTGGGTGIGAASALALARLSASVTLMGRRAKPLARTAGSIANETGHRAVTRFDGQLSLAGHVNVVARGRGEPWSKG